MAIKATISLKEKLYVYAKTKAEKYFSGNFSIYIAYLISSDMEQKQPVKTESQINHATAIDDILDGFK